MPHFVGECVSCHRPLKNSDYTFTISIKESDTLSQHGKNLLNEFVNTRQIIRCRFSLKTVLQLPGRKDRIP